MSRLTLFLIILYLISRLLFMNASGVFFDSHEYLHLFAYPNYFQAIISGHFPPHASYLILFWPVFQFGQLVYANPAVLVILTQIGLSLVTLSCFYSVTAFLSDKRTALIATIIASLTPLFWIVTETIMMENAYITLFFLSLYLLMRYIQQKTTWLLFLSLLSFGLAFLTEMLLVLWIPFVLVILFVKKKAFTLPYLVLLGCTLLLCAAANLVFITLVSGERLPAVFHHLYLTKSAEFSAIVFTPTGLLITFRNFLIPFMRNNTSLLTMLGLGSLVYFWFRDKKLFFLGLLWLAPAVYVNQWWDSLFPGRHALVATFGLAFLTGVLLQKRPAIIALLLGYLVIVSLPAVSLLREESPYRKEAETVSALPQNSLLVETHFAKPQVEETYRGKLVTVNDPLWSSVKIDREIHLFLSAKKPVYVTSGALSEPYGLYAGPYLHSLTLSYAKGFLMEPVLTKYTLVPERVINKEDNLLLYRVVSDRPSSYPEVIQLHNSRRRLDAADPIWKVWNWLVQ